MAQVRRRRWLLPVIAAAVIVVLAVVAVVLYFTLRGGGEDDGGDTDTTTSLAEGVVNVFTDMSPDDPAFEAALSMTGYGLLGADAVGRFRPADAVSRGEFASLVVSVFGLECPEQASPTFVDVAPGDPRYLDIEAAAPYFVEVTEGNKEPGAFSPNDPIKREEARLIVESLIEKAAPQSAAQLVAGLPVAEPAGAGQPFTRAEAARLLVPVIEGLQPAAAETFEALGIN